MPCALADAALVPVPLAADTPGRAVVFSTRCRRCERLARFLDGVRLGHPDYYARPVPAFGDPRYRLLIVGLAPGMHGANATGRPFTGDFAGVLLYRTLFEAGFASDPVSVSCSDELTLRECRITNAVRCVPPQNKPLPAEVQNCNGYLQADLGRLRRPGVVLALGTLAHAAVLRAMQLRAAAFPFGHGRRHDLHDDLVMLDSYHCSRYNTQTRRLTETMFRAVFDDIRQLLSAEPP